MTGMDWEGSMVNGGAAVGGIDLLGSQVVSLLSLSKGLMNFKILILSFPSPSRWTFSRRQLHCATYLLKCIINSPSSW